MEQNAAGLRHRPSTIPASTTMMSRLSELGCGAQDGAIVAACPRADFWPAGGPDVALEVGDARLRCAALLQDKALWVFEAKSESPPAASPSKRVRMQRNDGQERGGEARCSFSGTFFDFALVDKVERIAWLRTAVSFELEHFGAALEALRWAALVSIQALRICHLRASAPSEDPMAIKLYAGIGMRPSRGATRKGARLIQLERDLAGIL